MSKGQREEEEEEEEPSFLVGVAWSATMEKVRLGETETNTRKRKTKKGIWNWNYVFFVMMGNLTASFQIIT